MSKDFVSIGYNSSMGSYNNDLEEDKLLCLKN